MAQLPQELIDGTARAAGLIVAVIIGLGIHRLLFAALDRAVARTPSPLDESVVEHARRPASVLFAALALLIALGVVPVPADIADVIGHLVQLALIATAGWLVVSLTWVADDLALARYPAGGEDLHARAVRTQIAILRRVIAAGVAVVAGALMLLTIPGASSLGASLLASAGIIGIIVGVAARPVLSNLLAGVQIALTQPIRLGDVVVIDGEWGNIEEITTTYVVVRIWDLRRLVVPLSAIIGQPFENWTRRTANILGTVTIHADYRAPVDEVRAELHRILEASDLWDRQAWGLQVTEASERTISLRALMSAADSSAAWDLRCLVREQLVGFLRTHHPEALPRLRTEPGPRSTGTPAAVGS